MPRSLSIALFCLSAALPLQAQFDSGQIAGYIRDASEAVIASANVTLTNEGNGQQRQTTTNASGYYVIPNLPVGTYSASAESAGFKKTIQSGIVLDSAARLSIDLVLTVGAVTDSVEVKGR
jgi:hypothetical protein